MSASASTAAAFLHMFGNLSTYSGSMWSKFPVLIMCTTMYSCRSAIEMPPGSRNPLLDPASLEST